MSKRTSKPKANKLPKASKGTAPQLPLVAPPKTSFSPHNLDTFLYWIRERHSIHILRKAGAPAPWTRDSILQSNFFCNPFRENDKTTVWFRENLRGSVRHEEGSRESPQVQLATDPHVVLSTVAFRWFNYIPTGEVISQYGKDDDSSEANMFLTWPSEKIRSVLHYMSEGRGEKVFTGAYIIKSPNGQNKIDGICDCIDIVARCLNQIPEYFYPNPGTGKPPKGQPGITLPSPYSPQEVSWCDEQQDEDRITFLIDLFHGQLSLQQAHSGFMLFPFLGDFMVYEVVTDLRHTKYLCNAEDIMTWCNLGPGAVRGLLRLTGQFVPGPANGSYRAPRNASDLLLELLEITQAYFSSLNQRVGPVRCFPSDKNRTTVGVFPAFEMRDIEHSLCEFDKYSRVLNGEGSVKRLFDGS